jgi:hypothetical protein
MHDLETLTGRAYFREEFKTRGFFGRYRERRVTLWVEVRYLWTVNHFAHVETEWRQEYRPARLEDIQTLNEFGLMKTERIKSDA